MECPLADDGSRKKPSLQSLLARLNDDLAHISQEVEQIQWENIHLKCQLASRTKEHNAGQLPEKPEGTTSAGRVHPPDIDVGSPKRETLQISDAPDEVPEEIASHSAAKTSDGSLPKGAGKQLISAHSMHSDETESCQRPSQGGQHIMKSPWADHPEFFNVLLDIRIPGMNQTSSQLLALSRQPTQYKLTEESIHKKLRYVIHPHSGTVGVWILGCIVLLLYDLIMIPFDLCFDAKQSMVTYVVDIIAMIYWTLDILLTFGKAVVLPTGELEARPRQIAKYYIRSWFLFDLTLLLPEYVAIAIQEFPGDQVAVFRIARWGRLTRLLRLARVLRLVGMKRVVRWFAIRYHLSRIYVEVTHGLLGFTSLLMLVLHWMTCVWHALGDSLVNGWVKANGLESKDAGDRYIAASHWTASRFYGIASHYEVESSQEQLVDVLMVIISLAAFAAYCAEVTTVVLTRVNSKPTSLWRASISFSHRYLLSTPLELRVVKFMESSHYNCVSEIVSEENMFLSSLPNTLQEDIMFETRGIWLLQNQLFKDMTQRNWRVVRDVCNKALDQQVFVQTEVPFDFGDVASFMRFVTGRCFHYTCCSEEVTFQKQPGGKACLSEAGLWTDWQHAGKLVCTEESTLLALDVTLFGSLVTQHREALIHAVRYARHFIWRLNHQEALCDDLTTFDDLTLEALNEDLFDGTSEDHFVFISHYKVEAGTEATLIREELESAVRADLNHPANNLMAPAFIDSEDLSDLGRLQNHVVKSNVLLILLTPGLLSRPWCLLEIVTAVNNNVTLVPVEIQRAANSRYPFPDETFYAQLLAGELLSKDAVKVLEDEGIDLMDVERAIRQVFMKIALPFSPHKSKTVREAEMKDILRRCNKALPMYAKESCSLRASCPVGESCWGSSISGG